MRFALSILNPQRGWSKPIWLTMISLFLILGALAVSFGLYYACLFKPMLQIDQSPRLLQIEPNTTAVKLITQLKTQGFIEAHCPLLRYLQWHGYTQRLKAGVYQVKPGESASQFIKRIVAGDVIVESFKIIEGTTIDDLKRNLSQAPFLQFDDSVLRQFAQQYPGVEGLFLADTYQYQAPSNADIILKKSNQLLLNYLNQAFETRDPGLPYKNAYELLIAASILEKETALLSERKIISGIIVNRLRIHMPLQMDPTLIYGLYKSYGHILTREDIKLDTPYNTYKNRGLPPTPIAFVGKMSIDAAAHPTKTTYLYYVAKGDGTHQFSTTYQEQRRAIQQLR